MTAGILLVLDGWGQAPPGPANAIAAASTPCLNQLFATCRVRTLAASGRAVGLPDGVVGNSEIGHLVIGAGRPLDYDSLLVEREAEAGRLCTHPLLRGVCASLFANGGTLHLVGLASDGRIHSDIAHFGELLRAAGQAGLRRVAVHAITDGRDVPNGTARGYLDRLGAMMMDAGSGELASVIGRNYAMDKTGDTRLTAQSCRLILDGAGSRQAAGPSQALSWQEPADDGSVPATVIGRAVPVANGDAILFVNFRSDRIAPLADMMASRLRDTGRAAVRLLSLATYDTEHAVDALVARADASGGLADVLGAAGVRSVRIAEREKFDHVTFFLNGRDAVKPALEERVRVPGCGEPDYTRAHRMNIGQVVAEIGAASQRPEVGLVVANLANIDVVGHTGHCQATVAATEAVDGAVGQIADLARENGRWLVIVGDHGNGEQMTQTGADGTERPYGGHTTNPVPAVIVPDKRNAVSAERGMGPKAGPLPGAGTLADIAPTVLALLGLPVGAAMTGSPLV